MPCSPRMTRCKAECLHRKRVRSYQEERIRQEDTARELANGWDTEYREYLADHPLITFHEWLKQTKNPEPPAVEQAGIDQMKEKAA
jgi:hypothetical protein